MKRLLRVFLVVCIIFIVFSWMLLVKIRRNGSEKVVELQKEDEENSSRSIEAISEMMSNKKPVTIDRVPVRVHARTEEKDLTTKEKDIENSKFDTDEEISNQHEQHNSDGKTPLEIPSLTCSTYKPRTNGSLDQIAKLPPNERQSELCEREYGCGLLHTWKEQVIPMCEREIIVETSTSVMDNQKRKDLESNPTTLTCYKHNNKHLPSNSFPHTVCDSNNLVMDFSKMKPVPCLKYRPGYNCKRPTYYTYLSGALLGKCQKNSKNFNLDQFSKDFSKEIFSSFKSFKEANFKERKDSNIEFIDGITIFVSREQDEHVNLYYSMSDFFATYQMLEMFKLDSNNVQIVLLDEHYEGPFDSLWDSAFSFKRPMKRASEFNGKTVRFERAIFQHFATQFKSNLMDFCQYDSKQCKSKIALISGFSDRILHGLGIKKRRVFPGEIIRGIFISRQPTNQQSFLARQITNEDDLIESLQKHPEYGYSFTIEKVDLYKLSLAEQVKKVHNSDFLIGFHGSGLTHSLFLPEGTSSVLEIWKSFLTKSWRCYEQFTLWKGNEYSFWSNKDMKATRQDMFGDYLTVNVETFYQTFGPFLASLKNLRANLSS